MNAKQFAALLVELKACPEARKWASGKSLAVVWKTCKRGDWLLWLCGKMADKPNWPTRKEVVLAACDCVEPSLKHVPAGEERPRKCIETVRAWAAGNATIGEVRTAKIAAFAAFVANTADISYAAAYAAAYAAYAVDTPYAAWIAANAADAARTKILTKCAVLVRKRLKVQDTR